MPMRGFISPSVGNKCRLNFGDKLRAAALHLKRERLLGMFVDVIGHRRCDCKFARHSIR